MMMICTDETTHLYDAYIKSLFTSMVHFSRRKRYFSSFYALNAIMKTLSKDKLKRDLRE